ncbi:MAG: DUF4298 domain-containing protein [Clostridia bacterium]|nr:DUF4298 domain-containing protein [Clostridia bacterium]
MEEDRFMKAYERPRGKIDVVLDTDAYNEIDDQFAISYLLTFGDRCRIRGITAAPFFNERASSPADGMEKSYREIGKLLSLAGREDLLPAVYRGSERYLPDEQTPVLSPAAEFLCREAAAHTPGDPLYVVAIGAITNVASALLLSPEMLERCVVVWLGGHAPHLPRAAAEFNMQQDIAGARVLFSSGAPVVQLPCFGVVDRFATSRPELEYWLGGQNPLCDYLVENTVREAERYAAGKPWTRVIWDVTAVAWLFDGEKRFLRDTVAPAPVPAYDLTYAPEPGRFPICRVESVDRDALFADLFARLAGMGKEPDGEDPRIARIRAMEERFSRAGAALKRYEEARAALFDGQEEIRTLEAYYGGPLWREDLAADEAGELPASLRRGVLSEDGIYDLLTENGAVLSSLEKEKQNPNG